MDGKKLTGIAMAAAVVGLLGTGYTLTAEEKGDAPEKTVKCSGINGCSGKGECGAPDGSHDCAGKNSCKGKGWIKVETEEECEEKGGKVLKQEEEEEEEE